MKNQVDLNCDLGEWKLKDGASKDAAIMPFITSCNVACGGHIGDEESMRTTIRLAKKHRVSIGVHPAYPDPKNFGRVVMNISPEKLRESLIDQITSFKSFVEEEGLALHHVKPHGALYNHAAKDRITAETIVSVIKEIDKTTLVYLPPNSVSRKVALESGLHVITEVFADRVYEDDLSLRSRSFSDAVLHSSDAVLHQLQKIIIQEKVKTHSGLECSINAETMCLHSDTPRSIQLAKTIYEYLRNHGVKIVSP